VTWGLWTVFVHRAEAEVLGIAGLLTGRASLLAYPWDMVDALFIALPLSVAALAIGTLVERRRGSATGA